MEIPLKKGRFYGTIRAIDPKMPEAARPFCRSVPVGLDIFSVVSHKVSVRIRKKANESLSVVERLNRACILLVMGLRPSRDLLIAQEKGRELP